MSIHFPKKITHISLEIYIINSSIYIKIKRSQGIYKALMAPGGGEGLDFTVIILLKSRKFWTIILQIDEFSLKNLKFVDLCHI